MHPKGTIALAVVICALAGLVTLGQHHGESKGKTQVFVCAINCMDGRVQDSVKTFLQQKYKADFVDMVTEAGPNKILAENQDAPIVAHIKKRVTVSAHHHHATVVAIVGHHGCAGNPTSKDEQIQHLRKAKKTVESFDLKATIVLLWVNEQWRAELVE